MSQETTNKRRPFLNKKANSGERDAAFTHSANIIPVSVMHDFISKGLGPHNTEVRTGRGSNRIDSKHNRPYQQQFSRPIA